MLDSAVRRDPTEGYENEAWLFGFPIVALLIVLVVAQSALLPLGVDSSATGVCRQAGDLDAMFRALLLH
jgi:hypothetical protein